MPIPITIVNSSSQQIPLQSSRNSTLVGSLSNLPSTTYTNPDYDQAYRPLSAVKYGTSNFYDKVNKNTLPIRSSSNYARLYKTYGNLPSKPEYYDSQTNPTQSFSTVQAPSQHRTSLVIDDTDSRYIGKPTTYSTTYRSSYSRY